jgi:hypothetical protein
MHTMPRRAFAMLGFVAACAAVMPGMAAAQRVYNVIELGRDLPVGERSAAYGVNNSNVAVGRVGVSGSDRAASFTADGAHVVLSGTAGVALSINALGDIAGGAVPSVKPLYVDVAVWRQGVFAAMAMPAGGFIERAYAVKITDDLHVYGTYYDRYPPPAPPNASSNRGFVADSSLVASSNTWGGLGNVITAANESGAQVGMWFPFNAAPEGVRVTPGVGVEPVGPLVGKEVGYAYAIDSQGNIAGNAGSRTGPLSPFVLIGGRVRPFGLTGESSSQPSAMNDAGVVVGSSTFSGEPQTRAVVWKRGRTTDLSALPEALAAGWRTLYQATAVNNNGVIVGNGIRNDGTERGFMLIPRRRGAAD